MRRLENHGAKYALAPLYNVTALELMMTGRANYSYEIWEAGHNNDLDGSYAKILEHVKDYARKKNVDSAAKKSGSKGGDSMDLD